MEVISTSSGRVLRTGATIIYLIVVVLIHWFFIGHGFDLEFKILWLANGVAALLFGSRILNPHFTPVAVAASNSFVAGSALLLALASSTLTDFDRSLITSFLVVIGMVFIVSLMVLLCKQDSISEHRRWVLASEGAVRWAGAPLVMFTAVILVMAWLFHRAEPVELFIIVAVWTTIVALNPIEAIWTWVEKHFSRVSEDGPDVVGEIVAHQNPNLVLIRQQDGSRLNAGQPLLLFDSHGPTTLGVTLNYVGRDDGVLLRALSVKLPTGLSSSAKSNPARQVATKVDPGSVDLASVPELARIEDFCGIVDTDSNLDVVQVEVISDSDIKEGCLVDVTIGSESEVVYQIVDGVTREEAVQQKNKYGFSRARARKIGKWVSDDQNFAPVPWLPKINSPVYLKANSSPERDTQGVGHFPDTSYAVTVDPGTLVTHNTAVLGILGIGKSYLAIELVERMFGENIKVICLDLTDQYSELLSDFVDEDFQGSATKALEEAAAGRPVTQGKDEGGSQGAFNTAVRQQMSEFLSAECESRIWIVNPASFRVSRQTTNAYQGNAAFRDLTPSEITAIFSDAALKICQQLGMTTEARACLVYEEAHTLVPEWNSVASDGDKNATAASARAILQGRKFGLGCLLITQRTANVTKTILNQCNTIFAMRTFDDTGKEFLGNYIGSDYARVLPSLSERHAVLFGKASSCDNPVLLRLNDREDFITAYRAEKRDAGDTEAETTE